MGVSARWEVRTLSVSKFRAFHCIWASGWHMEAFVIAEQRSWESMTMAGVVQVSSVTWVPSWHQLLLGRFHVRL
jgi:hypothetical protein